MGNKIMVNGKEATSTANLATNVLMANGSTVETEVNKCAHFKNTLDTSNLQPRDADTLGGKYNANDIDNNFNNIKEIITTLTNKIEELENNPPKFFADYKNPIGGVSSGWTATQNCYVILSASFPYDRHSYSVAIDGVTVFGDGEGGTANGNWHTFGVFLKEGQRITYSASETGLSATAYPLF